MSPDRNIFKPEKMSLANFKMIKGQVETPEEFDASNIVGHQFENSLQLGFSIEEKLAKADITIAITSNSSGKNKQEASGNFHLIFIYKIENLEELAIPDKNGRLILNPSLANALSSVTYSTSRGILLTRLQGTALQQFVLPIINPNDLISHST